MLRHDSVMLEIKYLLFAGAVEINFVCYDGKIISIKRSCKIVAFLRPVSQVGCEKVEKMHLILKHLNV